MAETVATLGVPEVAVGQGGVQTQSPPPEFSGKWEDFAKDMAAITKEHGQVIEPAQPAEQPPQAVVTPAPAPTPAPIAAAPVVPAAVPAAQPAAAAPQQPQPQPPAPAPTEVPEKFRGPDGRVDQEKLMKSYLEAEKSLKRLQNAPQPAPGAQSASQPAAPGNPAPGPLTPFEMQVAQDIFNGGGFTEQQAVSMARVQVKLAEARHQADVGATFGRVAQLEETLAQQTSRAELAALARTNPEVLTPQGHAELVRVREENPWINNSPEPWRVATALLLGQKAMHSGPAGSVNTPTPTGAQQQAQPLPATPVPSAPQPIRLDTPEQLNAYVKTLTPEQEGEFWRRSGYKWDPLNKPYKGL